MTNTADEKFIWEAYLKSPDNKEVVHKVTVTDEGDGFKLTDKTTGEVTEITAQDALYHWGQQAFVFPDEEHKNAFVDSFLKVLQTSDQKQHQRAKKMEVFKKVLIGTSIGLGAILVVGASVIGGIFAYRAYKQMSHTKKAIQSNPLYAHFIKPLF